MQFEQIYDISVLLGVESINYPGDTPFQLEVLQTIEQGAVCRTSRLRMSPHAGTHLDAPAHFVQGAPLIDQLPVEKFILPAKVVEIQSPVAVTLNEIKDAPLKPGCAVLFKTRNSERGIVVKGAFTEDYIYIAPDAAQYCVDKGVALVGVDYISVERYGDDYSTHHILLGNYIPALEGLNLAQVPPGAYTLICLPLKLSGCEASPVRAVLIK